MPAKIKKRPIRRTKSTTPKRVVKTKPKKRKIKASKLNVFQAKCDDICNRLQAGDRDVIAELLEQFNLHGGGLQELTEAILVRHPMTINTRSFEPHFAASAYVHSPDVGHKLNHAPKQYVVFSSNELWLAVTITYVRLCKHVGKFL